MTEKLPRLQARLSIVDQAGRALGTFTSFWNQFATRIEAGLSVIGLTGIVVSTGDGSAVSRSIVAGTGIAVANGSGAGGDPTVSISNTAVTAGSYGDASHVAGFTVNAQGQITHAAATPITYPAAPVSSVFGRIGAVISAANDYNFSQVSQGTATNGNAAAGFVGEYLESEILVGAAVALVTATAKDVTSLALTAGDWDVWGEIATAPAAGTTTSSVSAWISATSATLPAAPNKGAFYGFSGAASAANATIINPVGKRRISLAAPGTVYLSAQIAFAVSTLAAYGGLYARRAR